MHPEGRSGAVFPHVCIMYVWSHTLLAWQAVASHGTASAGWVGVRAFLYLTMPSSAVPAALQRWRLLTASHPHHAHECRKLAAHAVGRAARGAASPGEAAMGSCPSVCLTDHV